MNLFLILLTIVLLPFSDYLGAYTATGKTPGYNFSSPDQIITLPVELKEISGITIIDSESVACIQDEAGILFIYNFRENRIKQKLLFGDHGDYEDITLAGKTIYVLRSDGTLYEISDFMAKSFNVNRYRTGVPSDNSEGMCYDKNKDRLLIGCKGAINKEDLKNKRAIYSFDLKTRKLIPDPVFVFDPKTVNKSIPDNKTSVSGKKEKKVEIEIRISALGLQPQTGKLFFLSATDFVICVVNSDGTIGNIEFLENELFRQAEGMAFFPNGDMLITNEGKNNKPTLLRFNYKGTR